MDLLKRELERKKKELQDAKTKKKCTDGRGSSSRFIRASELRRLIEENEDADDQKAEPIDVQQQRTRERDRSAQEESSSSSILKSLKPERQGNNDTDTRNSDSKEQPAEAEPEPSQKKRKTSRGTKGTDRIISEASATCTANQQSKSLEQVKRELRSFGLPISLFGETSLEDRVERLDSALKQKAVAQLHETEADEFRLGQGHGIRNPFLEKEDAVNDDAAATAASEDLAPQKDDPSKGNRGTAAKKGDDKANDGGDDTADPHKRVYRHFKGLLKQWEADLNDRSDTVKRSLAGRNETKTVKQCKDYIRPLFQLCKRRQLEDGLLNKLVQMVQFCEQGEFVKAHDAYLDVAIGRAAWPIGVTMVGIHARSGRAKIESSNVAHVMNSELQRKYLTSVKRLLTYEQTKRTDVDPSKKVMN